MLFSSFYKNLKISHLCGKLKKTFSPKFLAFLGVIYKVKYIIFAP